MPVSLSPLRPNITPSAIQRMKQLAAKKAKAARLAAEQATAEAARKAQEKASKAALKRPETEDELLRRQALEALERFEASIPLRRPPGTVSTDLTPGAQKAEFHRDQYLRNTCIKPWGLKLVTGRKSSNPSRG